MSTITIAREVSNIEREDNLLIVYYEDGHKEKLDITEVDVIKLADGTQLSINDFFSNYDIVTAAGQEAQLLFGGLGSYNDDPGELIGGLDRLGHLGSYQYSLSTLADLTAHPYINTAPELDIASFFIQTEEDFLMEHDSISGQLKASDREGDKLTYTLISDAQGKYGTFTMSTDGKWTYTRNQDVNWMAEGETYTEKVLVRVSDGRGGTVESELTVEIAGDNDLPVPDEESFRAATEEDYLMSHDTISGQLIASDVDEGDKLTYSLVSSAQGKYGTFTVDANGKWTYTRNQDVNWMAEGQTYTEKVIVRVSDNNGGIVERELTVEIAGNNDIPVITDVNLTTNAKIAAIHAINGSITTSDIDDGDSVQKFDASKVTATINGKAVDLADYGEFKINNDGTWSLVPVTAKQKANLFSLPKGQQLKIVADIVGTDTHGGEGQGNITVTINGEFNGKLEAQCNEADIPGIGSKSDQGNPPASSSVGDDLFPDVKKVSYDTSAAADIYADTGRTSTYTKVVWKQEGNNLIGYANGRPAIRITAEFDKNGSFTGNVKTELLAAIKHNGNEKVSTTIKVNQHVDSKSVIQSNVDIQITDDSPTAAPAYTNISSYPSKSEHIVLVLDSSGSMRKSMQAQADTTLAIIAKYTSLGIAAKFSVVYFSSGATIRANHVDANTARNIISKRLDSGGATNYEAAQNAARSLIDKSNLDKQSVYFISDGNPYPSENNPKPWWKDYVVTKNVQVAAIGVGKVKMGALYEIAGNRDGNIAVHVNNFAEIFAKIEKNISLELNGNIFEQSIKSADVCFVSAIKVNGQWVGVGTYAIAGGVTITVNRDGTFKFIVTKPLSHQISVEYQVQDADGSTTTSHIVLTDNNQAKRMSAEIATEDKEATTAAEGKEAITAAEDKEAITAAEDKEAITAAEGKEATTAAEDKEAITAAEDKEAITAAEDKEAITAAEGKEATTAAEDKEAITAAEDKEAITAAEDKEAITAAEGKEATTAAEDKEAITAAEGKEAITAAEGKEAITAAEGKEASAAATEIVKMSISVAAKNIFSDLNDMETIEELLEPALSVLQSKNPEQYSSDAQNVPYVTYSQEIDQLATELLLLHS